MLHYRYSWVWKVISIIHGNTLGDDSSLHIPKIFIYISYFYSCDFSNGIYRPECGIYFFTSAGIIDKYWIGRLDSQEEEFSLSVNLSAFCIFKTCDTVLITRTVAPEKIKDEVYSLSTLLQNKILGIVTLRLHSR